MNILLDILLPRFVTDEVAVNYNDAGVPEVFCRTCDLTDDDTIDAIGTVKGFNLFGVCLFPRLYDVYVPDYETFCRLKKR